MAPWEQSNAFGSREACSHYSSVTASRILDPTRRAETGSFRLASVASPGNHPGILVDRSVERLLAPRLPASSEPVVMLGQDLSAGDYGAT